MKKSKFLTKVLPLFFILFCFSFASKAMKVCFDETVSDDDGCIWRFKGCITLSVGWGVSVSHWEVTGTNCHGDTWHWVGRPALVVILDPHGKQVDNGNSGIGKDKFVPEDFTKPIESSRPLTQEECNMVCNLFNQKL